MTKEQQAEYTVQGIEWARENWPWLGVVNLWYFRQVGDVPPDRAAYYFGLVDPEFNPQPVYEAVRQAAQGIGIASAGLHQGTSPAVTARGWHLVLDPVASAGAALVGDATSEPLTFTFEGPQVSLVARRGPDQGLLAVQVDGEVPDGMERDGEGRAVVDLGESREEGQATVRLARGLGEGVHRLMLTPQGTEPAAVDAFVVSEGESDLLLYLLWGMCGVLILVGAVLWARASRS